MDPKRKYLLEQSKKLARMAYECADMCQEIQNRQALFQQRLETASSVGNLPLPADYSDLFQRMIKKSAQLDALIMAFAEMED